MSLVLFNAGRYNMQQKLKIQLILFVIFGVMKMYFSLFLDFPCYFRFYFYFNENVFISFLLTVLTLPQWRQTYLGIFLFWRTIPLTVQTNLPRVFGNHHIYFFFSLLRTDLVQHCNKPLSLSLALAWSKLQRCKGLNGHRWLTHAKNHRLMNPAIELKLSYVCIICGTFFSFFFFFLTWSCWAKSKLQMR